MVQTARYAAAAAAAASAAAAAAAAAAGAGIRDRRWMRPMCNGGRCATRELLSTFSLPYV